MRGVMLTIGAILMTFPLAHAADPSSQIQSLLALGAKQNDQCGDRTGDSPATQRACDAHNATARRLDTLGYCYGEPDQFKYRKTRHPCAEPIKWSRSREPDGHVWPDGHTCATVMETPDRFLAVRSGPAARYPQVGALRPNDFVDVTACKASTCHSSAWRQISLNAGDERSLRGWVNARFLHQTACLDEP
jgi:hypothetical protein